MNLEKLSVNKFNDDIKDFGGYSYSQSDRFSTRMAVRRRNTALETLLVRNKVDLTDFTVLDIGSGDGVYTHWFADKFHPRSIVGIDAAGQAVQAANSRYGSSQIAFIEGSAYTLPFADKHFDLVIVREVLHHLDEPEKAIREVGRVAKAAIILEPNGGNLILKVIEKASRYHREHGEKSYHPTRIDRWLRAASLKTVTKTYFGIVPVFAPEWFTKFLLKIEPWFERVPFLNRLGCGSVWWLVRA